MPYINRSISLQFLVPVGTLLLILMCGMVWRDISVAQGEGRDALRARGELTAKIMADGLGEPLWNLDIKAATELLKALHRDADFLSAVVLDDKGKVVVTEGVGPPPSTAVTMSAVINRGSKTLGEFRLALGVTALEARIAARSLHLMLLAGTALVVIMLTLIVLTHGVTRPIMRLTQCMAGLAQGRLDVVVADSGRRDQIGQMARAVEVSKANAETVRRLTAEHEAAAQHGLEERKTLLTQLSGNFEASVRDALDRVVRKSTDIAEHATLMANQIANADSQGQTVRDATGRTADNVATVAAAAEQLALSIREISARIIETARLSNQAAVSSETSQSEIAQLEEQTNGIGTIVQLIKGIASQTNLLALNATIEAARAGDAGKGFAVVASEVKSLAQQTEKATQEVGGKIAAIQGATQRAVRAVQSIAKMAQELSEASSGIAAAIEEQGVATQEIARSSTQASAGTQTVAAAIGEVGNFVQDAAKLAANLRTDGSDLTSEMRGLGERVGSFLGQLQAA